MVRDPESRSTQTGKQVSEFTIAVDKRIKPTNNEPTADFFRIKVWGQGADYIGQYGAKGRLVSVDGRLENRKFQDKDGNSREVTEIVADNVSLLDRPTEDRQAKPEGQSKTQNDDWDPFRDDA
jgi:single-strand DNA-binding protein